ncbi:MAG: DNA polymerase III subunit delta [candidate division WOR-3 bacterium]
MKVLTPKQFSQLIKKEVPSIVLVTGTEYSLILKVVESVKKTLGIPDESVRYFEGKASDLGEVYDAMSVSNLFGDKRLCVFKDTRAVCGSLRERGIKDLIDFARGRKGLYVIFIDFVDEKAKQKETKAYTFLYDNVTVVSCRKPGDKELREWLVKKLKKYGIDEDFADYLMDATDGSFDLLEKELEKIQLVRDKDVVVSAKAYTPFEMVSLALKGDFRAFEALDFILDSGVYPQIVLGALQKKIRTLFLFKLGLIKNVSSYQRSLLEEETKGLTIEDMKNLILSSFLLERRIKQGFLDYRKALTAFILDIFSIRFRQKLTT